MCVADSSSSRDLLQMGSSVNPSLKRCPFRWQCPVNSPTTQQYTFIIAIYRNLISWRYYIVCSKVIILKKYCLCKYLQYIRNFNVILCVMYNFRPSLCHALCLRTWMIENNPNCKYRGISAIRTIKNVLLLLTWLGSVEVGFSYHSSIH
jgi:hypothetical protein